MTINNIRNYETTFIVRPDLDDAVLKETVQKFVNYITNNGGKITNQENWGMRKLAYSINRHSTGYYVFIEFQSEGGLISNLEREYQYDERIIRSLTIALNKHAAAWNDRRRVKLKGQA